MEQTTKIDRNRPSAAGIDNDPDLRDDAALQPGISTISSSNSDEENNNLTETASGNFAEEEFYEGADEGFDDVKQDENK